jgi:hypothetical protein
MSGPKPTPLLVPSVGLAGGLFSCAAIMGSTISQPLDYTHTHPQEVVSFNPPERVVAVPAREQ